MRFSTLEQRINFGLPSMVTSLPKFNKGDMVRYKGFRPQRVVSGVRKGTKYMYRLENVPHLVYEHWLSR